MFSCQRPSNHSLTTLTQPFLPLRLDATTCSPAAERRAIKRLWDARCAHHRVVNSTRAVVICTLQYRSSTAGGHCLFSPPVWLRHWSVTTALAVVWTANFSALDSWARMRNNDVRITLNFFSCLVTFCRGWGGVTYKHTHTHKHQNQHHPNRSEVL